jgi:RES domain-containing protein
MIVIALDKVAYRVHDPKWSFAPTSGAGADKYGGRANRLASTRSIYRLNCKLL